MDNTSKRLGDSRERKEVVDNAVLPAALETTSGQSDVEITDGSNEMNPVLIMQLR